MQASIGVATGQPDGEPGQLLRNADVAMYTAKSHGKHRYEVFESGMHSAVLPAKGDAPPSVALAPVTAPVV